MARAFRYRCYEFEPRLSSVVVGDVFADNIRYIAVRWHARIFLLIDLSFCSLPSGDLDLRGSDLIAVGKRARTSAGF